MKRNSLTLILASTLLAQAATAQSFTPTVGYYKQEFPDVGAYAVSVGFTAKKDFQGAMTSSALAGANTNIEQTGAAFGTFGNHYVEILSGSNLGLILDIDSNDADTITVVGNVTLSAGTTYCVREHVTLGGLLADSSGVVAGADLVILLDPAGNEINALYDGGGVWSDASTLADLSNYPIYPGGGFLFLPAEPRTLTIGGGKYSYVKDGQTRVSLSSGIPALVGLINPLVATNPADPIYSTTAVNTLTQFGLRVDPPVAGMGMTADSDLAVLLSNDGVLDTVNNVLLDSGSNNLLDAITSANLNNTQIRNGVSLLYIPGGDYSFVLPQRH
jgi:hypothetical protein